MIDEAATLKDESLRASEDNNEKLPQSPSSEKDEKQLKKDAEDGEEAKDGEENKKKAVDDPDSKVLHGFQLWAVYFSLLFSIFLVALDQTILAPALPVIVSKFNALNEIGWVSSAYFLTQSGLMLFWGTVLNVCDRKWIFISSVIIFEIGSLLCGVSTTVNLLIFGRAVAGVGAAAIFVSILSIITEITTLEQRPVFFGGFGGVFGLSSIIGPLIGGAFTDHVSWRWCFYINLPVGALSIAVIVVIIKNAAAPALSPEMADRTRRRMGWLLGIFGARDVSATNFFFRLMTLDWVGSTLLLGAVTCLLLALQWGGNDYPWNDGRVIGCFVGSGVILAVLIPYEYYIAGPQRVLPLNFFTHRTQVASGVTSFFVFFAFIVFCYWIPINWQAAKNHSATKSGLDLLPFLCGVIVFTAITGIIVKKTGNFYWIIASGPPVICIASGLFFTIDEHDDSKLYGFQVLLAYGVGSALQNVLISVQANTKDPRDLNLFSACFAFLQRLGTTVGISIAATIFGNKLSTNLDHIAREGTYDPSVLAAVELSVQAIYTVVPVEQRPAIVHEYVNALSYVYLLGIGAGGVAFISALCINSVNIKKKTEKPNEGEKAAMPIDI